jgi:hypothetical protein
LSTVEPSARPGGKLNPASTLIVMVPTALGCRDTVTLPVYAAFAVPEGSDVEKVRPAYAATFIVSVRVLVCVPLVALNTLIAVSR